MTEKLASRENAFRRSERKFRRLFEVSNDGIIIHDRDQKILQVNKRMEEMVGFARDYFSGKRIIDLHVSDERERAEERFSGTDSVHNSRFESKYMKSDGETIIVDIRSSLIDPEEGIIQSIVRDITQGKRAEEELKAHMKEVSEANRHLDVLVSTTTDRKKKRVDLKREINALLVGKGDNENRERAPQSRGGQSRNSGGVRWEPHPRYVEHGRHVPWNRKPASRPLRARRPGDHAPHLRNLRHRPSADGRQGAGHDQRRFPSPPMR